MYCRGSERYSLNAKFFERYCRPQLGRALRRLARAAMHGQPRAPPSGGCRDRATVHFSARRQLPARPRLFPLHPPAASRSSGRADSSSGTRDSGRRAFCQTWSSTPICPAKRFPITPCSPTVDDAVYGGMMGGGVCHPWTLDSPVFASPEGVAKMAAWGFFPHVGLGMQPRGRQASSFPSIPTTRPIAFALPYWRILSAIDMSHAQVFNLPNQKPVAATCTDETFRRWSTGLKTNSYLVIVSNLGTKTSKTTVNLVPEVLGMSGAYSIERVDAQSGAIAPHGTDSTHIETSLLPPWGIEGFRLTPASAPMSSRK